MFQNIGFWELITSVSTGNIIFLRPSASSKYIWAWGDRTVRRYLSSMSLQPPPSLVGCTGGKSLISSFHETVLPGLISSGLETAFNITVDRRTCLSAWNAACYVTHTHACIHSERYRWPMPTICIFVFTNNLPRPQIDCTSRRPISLRCTAIFSTRILKYFKHEKFSSVCLESTEHVGLLEQLGFQSIRKCLRLMEGDRRCSGRDSINNFASFL